MADLVVDPAQVTLGKGPHKIKRSQLAGEPIDAGEAVRRDPQTSKMFLADADTNEAELDGLALNTAEAVDQPVDVVTEGEVILGGSAVSPGICAHLSATPGKITDGNQAVSGQISLAGVGSGPVNGDFRFLVRPVVTKAVVV